MGMKNFKKLSKEEKLNVWSHGLGALGFLFVAPLFFIALPETIPTFTLVAFVYYFISLVFLFLMSTCYHYHIEPKKKEIFRILDHIAIVVLISGSYTSFISYFLPTATGFTILTIHSLISLIVIVFKVFFTGKYEFVSILLYLSLGWMVAFIFHDLIAQMYDISFALLICGAISYTIGVIFYAIPKIPYHHFIWHIFVVIGSASHLLSLSLGVF